LRRFKRYPEFWRRLETGLQSLDSRLYYSHGTRTAGEVFFKEFLLYLKITIKKKAKNVLIIMKLFG
jgi:hypothetical protein